EFVRLVWTIKLINSLAKKQLANGLSPSQQCMASVLFPQCLAHPRTGRPAGLETGCRMTDLLSDYLPIVIFLGLAGVIGLALLIAPFIVAVKNPDPEKVSAFEAGFEAFDDARMKFDVRFYLVCILFIIFDLEVAFLFPWAVAFRDVGWFGFWS